MFKNLADMFRSLFGRRTRKSVTSQRRREFFNQFRKGQVEGLEDRSLMAQLLSWDFFGENTGVATSPADFVASNLDASTNVTRGATAAASTASNSFRTTGFQNNGISTANTDYFQATISASPGFELNLGTLDARFAGTATFRAAPGASGQFAYSTDGTNFTLIGSPFSLTADAAMPQISLSGITALQHVPDSTTVTLRYYASGQTTTGGWGFNSPAAGQYGLDIRGTVDAVGVNTSTTTSLTTVTPLTVTGGDNVTFSGTVVADSGTTTPGGTVEIRNGGLAGTLLATAPITGSGVNGAFTITSNTLPTGTYNNLQAFYVPTAGFSGSNSAAFGSTLTVNAPVGATLAAGDVAVVGYNTQGSPNDFFMIVALRDLSAGTTFFIGDNEIAADGGAAFTDLAEGVATFTVKNGQSIPAGTVISLPWGAGAVSATAYDYSTTSSFGLGNNNDEIYIYTAPTSTSTTPTAFIYGAAIGTSPSQRPLGLTTGSTFITPTIGSFGRYKTTGASYSGNQTTLLAAIGNTAANWENVAPGATTDWTFSVVASPTVTSPTSAAITETAATLGGNITAGTGITERGVVYSLTSDNADPLIGGSGVIKVVEGGTTTGVFTTSVSPLTASSGYSFKAYAINASGTSYSSVATFTTQAPAAAHQAPQGTDKTVTFNEDGTYTFAAADFGFSDPNDTPADAFARVKITTLPTAGTLTLSGSPVAAGDFVTVANIPNLLFTPVANANGIAYATLTFQVEDNGSLAGGGQNLDGSANAFTFNVTSVNDAPAGADKTVTASIAAGYVFVPNDFGFADATDTPANTLLAVKIASLPAVGTLTSNNVAVGVNDVIPVADILGGKLKFAAAGGATAGLNYANFTFQVQDNGGTANGGVDLDQTANTLTIDLNAATPLVIGDIAFTAVHSDSGAPDSDFFQFVALRDMGVGTTIYFFDSPFNGTAFQANESGLRWVAQTAVTAGTTFSFASAPGGGSVANTPEWTGIVPTTGAVDANAAFGLSTSGESIHAVFNPTFGGTNALTGTVLAAVYFGEVPSTFPAGVVLGTNAVSIGNIDNGQYDPNIAGSIESGSPAVVRASINTASNWLLSDNSISPPGTSAVFTIVETPEINIQGSGLNIADGDNTPSTADGTDFGAAVQGGAAIDRTFTIQNLGAQPLVLSGGPNFVGISGGSNFSILTQPSGTIAAGASATFVVRMIPTIVATQTATITIANNDPDEGSYDFQVTSVVTSSAAATTTALTTVTPVNAAAGDNITFAGTVVAGSGSGTPAGTIEIRNGGSSGTLLATTTSIGGTGVNGTFNIVTTTVPAGTYNNIQAFFIPGAGFQASNSSPFVGTLDVVAAPTYVNYNAAGVTYSQNFNSLINTGTVTLSGNGPFHLADTQFASTPITGWYFSKYAGTGNNALFNVNDGASGSGSIYSYGATGASDRALGSTASGTTISRFGAVIRNTTGSTLDTFTITFDGEQWRNGVGSSTGANVLDFEYAIGVAPGGTIDGTGFTGESGLDFTAPVTSSTEGPIDGNTAGLTAGITKTISGISWAAGTDLILRWTDINDTGNDDGLAVDNFAFSANTTAPNGSLSFSSPTYNVTENGVTATVTVNRVSNAAGAIAVNYSTVPGGTAVAGTDYTTTSGTLNWANGDNTPKTFTIPITDNLTLNANKTINLALSNPTGGATLAGTTTSVLTIRENEQASQVLLNEFVANPPTNNDRPYEYIEVRGTPGTTLGSYYVVQIDGGSVTPANTGNVWFMSELSNATLGSNGLLIIAATTGGHTVSGPTTVVGSSLLDVANGRGLINTAQTMAIIFSPTPLALDMDLDTNDDGTLDLPAGASLVDAVGWTDNSDANAGLYAGKVYGGAEIHNEPFPLNGSGTPDAASRIYNNTTPLSSAAWYGGDIADTGTPSSVTYDPNKATANLPPGANVSPGVPNSGLSISTSLGSLSQSEGNSGLTAYTFTISRAGDLSTAVDVTWTVSGSGTSPATAADFENGAFPTGLTSFAVNEAVKTITVNVIGDTSIETTERFAVTLSNPTNGATLASPIATAAIVNDDYQALTAGDVVLTGINTSNPDQFSFVPLVNLEPNSPINFTDNGWDGFGFTLTEGTVTYTAPAGGLAAGTKVIIQVDGTVLTVTGGGTAAVAGSFGLNGTGDSLIAYVGASFVPTFLFAVNTNNLYLSGEVVDSTTTYLPGQLTIGTSAVAPLAATGTIGNAQYTGTTNGTAAELRALVADKANWTTSTGAQVLSTVNFTFGGNTAPTINAQSFSVAENAASGSTVGTVVASDANAGQTLSYAFVVSGSPTQVSGPFTISATTGQITVTDALDFETTPSYTTTVRVTDNGGPALSTDGTVTINVTDRSEGRVFIPTTLTANAGGTLVVPVNLNVTEVDGAAVSSAVISLAYDSSKFTFNSINLAGGPLAGFSLDTSSSTPGNLVFTATGTAGALITSGTTVTLANVTFNVAAGAAAGASELNLRAATNISDATPNLFLLGPAITDGSTDANVDGSVAISAGPLAIASIVPTATGFVVTFNRPVNPANLNLYQQTGAGGILGAADVTLVGTTTGAVRGSVVFNSTNTAFTFIKTGMLTTETGVAQAAGRVPGILAPDTYTVTLRSNAADGFVDLAGNALRDFAGATAGDYTTTFNVATPATGTVTISVPDFARGYGQAVRVPNTAATGLPVVISDGTNVASVSFRLNFDPTLLSVTSFVVNPAIVGASATFTAVSPGVVQVTMSSASAFAATADALSLGEFVSAVPDTATYAAKDLLTFTNVQIGSVSSGPLPTLIDNGLHISSFLGDVNGSQSYNAADTGLIQRAILGINSGFAAYQLADPYIVGDINHSLSFAAADTGFVQRQILNIVVPNIPALPVGVTPPVGTPGPDPKLFIPNNLSGSVDADGNSANGIQVDIPVMLEVTEPSGITMNGFDLTFSYDPTKLTIPGSAGAPTSLSFGSFLAGAGFSGAYTIPSPGLVQVTASSGGASPQYAFGTVGALFTIRATVVAGATGTTKLNLRSGASVVDTDFIDLTLIPAPTNADTDSVDGAVVFAAPVNNPPVFVGSPYTFSLPENSATNAAVGSVSANDADAGTTLVYSLSGTGSSNFAINPSTGAITVAAGATLNFEGTASFALTASVSDGTATVNAPVTINLTNVVEPTTFANQTFSLPENTANGITVGTATAVPDTGVTITGYAITAGNGTGVGAFSINSSGVIQVNDGSQLNFEVTPTFTLTVTATDSTSAVTTSTVTVNLTNVNEQPIQTLNRTITINPGQVIQLGSALLSFADPENATLTYTITSAPTRGTLTKNGAAITSFTSTDLNASSSLGNAIRYTGTTGTAGQTDSFTVTVSDGANTITGVVVNINIVAPVGPASFTGVYTQNFDNLLPTPVPADRLTLPTAMVLPAGWSVIEYGGTFGTVGGNAEQSIQIDSGTSTTGDTFLYGNPGSNERSLGAFSSGSLQAYLGLAIVNNSGAPLSNFTLSFVGEQWKDGVHASAVNKLTFDYSTTATSLGATTGFTSVTALDFTAPVAAAVTGADVVLDGNLAANRTAVSATVTGVSWAPGATLFLRWKDLNDAGNDDMLAIDNVTLSTNTSPTIANQAFSLAENSANGAAAGTVVASDADVGQTLSYAITGGNASGAFAINASTGAITVADSSQLNFETTPSFPLTVTVTDDGASPVSSSATVTINLTNVDEAPTFGAASYSLSVAENSTTGAAVGAVSATDPDAGASLTYSLSGTGSSNFVINPSTGAITVASGAVLNFEGTNTFSLTASVTDGTHPVSVPVTISLTNVNEAPTIGAQSFSVSEQAAIGATVGTVLASDVDAADTKTFAITGGNTGNAFAISASGVITVAAELDFNTTPVYTLTVSVTDGGNLSASNTVTINVTNVNSAPTIAPQTFSVAENSANGAAVGTVVANDVDASDSKSFAITAGNSSGAFAINASTGAITVANGSLLNFEATPSYSLTVSVTDGGSLSASATITINLTNVNEAPAITSGNAFSVAENTTAVTTVTGLDPDAIATLAYSIVGGLDAGKFTIDHDLGLLSFLSAPNFENPGDIGGNNVYDLIVRVSDGSLSGDKAIAVTVTNVNEAPTIANQSFSVLDTVATGFTVGTVVANDVDAGDTKTFAITGGNTGNAFAISPSGVITVANTLNSAVTPSYSLTVSVTDAGNLSSSATVTITVNHLNSNPTNISLSNATIAENAGVNGVVGLLSTTDPDLPSDTHTYTLMTTGTGSTDFASFNISGNQLRANGNLDFETKPSYSIRVKSTDQGGASVEKVFTIFVTDVPETGNQAPTNIALSGSTVAPSSPTGTVIGNLTTTDPNSGNTFTYSLGGVNAAKFMIAGTMLRMATPVIEPVGTVYNITVTSTDQGGLSFTKAFTITVGNAANVAPTFINLTATSIAENNLPNDLVSFLTSVDANPGNTFTYELVSGTGSADNALFSIPTGTNELRANVSFDFEAKTSYQIRIRSTDQGGLSTERAVTVYIANVVETGNQAPTNISLSNLTVRPAAPAATVVGNLTTTDPNPGNTFTYTLSGPDAGKFIINSHVLQVAPAAVIGPVGTTYTISITSTDQGNASITKTFTITVANPVNVAPTGLVLSSSIIPENAGPNALIGWFTPTDPNSGDTHTYSLASGLGGDDNALFTIVGNQLFAVNSFDYELKTSYKIRVRTTDQGGLFYDKAITVFVSDVTGA
ncbi:cadherin domain-containing protein [Anatilimnocola floriformis]|uniref:cadherin domain-containing protein n=1 Tax=Anatilimnocola floriformis TaxID=2948575 RepID=UPI0020C56911|nr:cadherin domain-containing protein [Anatilimnocola floriformis]